MKNIRIYAFADEANVSIDGQISAMKRNSIDGLEARTVDGINISDITDKKASELKKKLDDAGLITWSIGSPIGKIDIEKDDFENHLEKFKRTLNISQILDCKNIRLFSFFIPEEKNPDDYKNEVIERLGKFLEISKGSNIKLCHENEKGIFGDTARRCLSIHKALPELKGIFDPANFIQCGQNTLEAWGLLKNHIFYMHIKDAFSTGDIVPAGKGEGNLAYIVNDFLNMGGKDFTIEPHLSVFKGLETLEKDSNESKIGNKYIFKNNDEAFDTACEEFKNIIKR